MSARRKPAQLELIETKPVPKALQLITEQNEVLKAQVKHLTEALVESRAALAESMYAINKALQGIGFEPPTDSAAVPIKNAPKDRR